MSAAPRLDVVVPIHDLSRPIARCVASLVADLPPGAARVTVVAHGIRPGDVERLLAGVLTPDVRVVGFEDGIKSSSGPFNHGISLATADYVFIIGSDDFVEPGAIQAWIDRVDAERPDVLLVGLRYQGGAPLRSPVSRPGRTRGLDPVKDRLFYRTAPLALLRRAILPTDRPLFDPVFPVGADMHLSTRLYLGPGRIDFDPRLPRYVIGLDAVTRVTTSPRPVEETLRTVVALVERPWIRAAAPSRRRSLAIKLLRIQIIDAVRSRPTAARWTSQDVEDLQSAIRAILGLDEGALSAFARADRRLIEALLAAHAGSDIELAWNAFGSSGRFAQLVPRNPFRLFDREGTVRRYILYRLPQRTE